MNKIIMMLLLIVSTNVLAKDSHVDTTGLDVEQQAIIAKQIAQLKEESKNPINVSAKVRNEAIAWTDLGANMGKAMVGAAKEVGVAASEFAKTDLGKITVAIVAYKLVGKDILSAIIGASILIFGFIMSAWIITTRRWSEVQYEHVPVFWNAFTIKRVVKSESSTYIIFGKLVGSGVCFCLTLLVGLKTIF